MSKKKHIEIMSRGVCVKDNRLLLCHTRGADNTYLPGGHIDFNESARDSLVREIQEEMGLESAAGAFLGGVEHTFIQEGTRHCEVNLVFRLDIHDLDSDAEPPSCEDYIEFIWLALDDISDSDLEPASLRDCLTAWLAGDRDVESWSSTY